MTQIEASILRLAYHHVDIKVIRDGNMHVLQWRRKLLHDEVLLDGKLQQTSYGLWGRETIYGLVFGSDQDGQNGTRLMLAIDPVHDASSSDYWMGNGAPPRGLRLEGADGPLLAHGTMDERQYDKPSDFTEWAKKTLGMKW